MATVIGPTPGTIQVQIGLKNMNVTTIKLSYVSRKTHKNIAVSKYVIFCHKVMTTIKKKKKSKSKNLAHINDTKQDNKISSGAKHSPLK